MQYQKEKGIYVYFLRSAWETDGASTEVEFRHYLTLEHFFWLYYEDQIKDHIGHSIYDKKCNHVVDTEYGRGYCGRRYTKREILCEKVNCTKHNSGGQFFYAVYDENCKQYLPDELVGLRRAWINDKKASKDFRNRYNCTSNGKKKQVYGRYRHMKTFQERKWAEAWNDEEFAPKTRRARVGYHLPDIWDDWHVHNDKSWKTQSKRKKQWKHNEKV